MKSRTIVTVISIITSLCTQEAINASASKKRLDATLKFDATKLKFDATLETADTTNLFLNSTAVNSVLGSVIESGDHSIGSHPVRSASEVQQPEGRPLNSPRATETQKVEVAPIKTVATTQNPYEYGTQPTVSTPSTVPTSPTQQVPSSTKTPFTSPVTPVAQTQSDLIFTQLSQGSSNLLTLPFSHEAQESPAQ